MTLLRPILSSIASKMTSTTTNPLWTPRPYSPHHPTWPYTPDDFTRADPSPDPSFYATPRLVTHIDAAAIARLRAYYAAALPRSGRILDFCSSWVSHYPAEVEGAARRGEVEVLGAGMNGAELRANAVLARRPAAAAGSETGARWPLVRDLNVRPDWTEVLGEGELVSAATCVVSVDYLTRPREVLGSLRTRMERGGAVHLVVSNRCFPTKAVARRLRVGEEERLNMVGDYLAFSGWSNIEIVESPPERSAFGWGDPLWVVRGVNEG